MVLDDFLSCVARAPEATAVQRNRRQAMTGNLDS
jgi:hypothetical protein